MRPQDWFGLGVRFAGVWCAIQTVLNLTYFVDVRLGFAELRGTLSGLRDSSPVGYLLYAAVYAALAAYFLLGAEHLTRLSFGDSRAINERETELAPGTAVDNKDDRGETGVQASRR